MIYLLGLLIAFVSIAGAIFHLHQSAGNYFDIVALFVVVGGTISIAVITLPWEYYPEIWLGLKHLVRPRRTNPRLLVNEAMRIVETRGTATQHDEDLQYTLAGEILSEGSEMLALGFNATQIQTILGERIHHTSERRLRIAHAVRGLAKYPPAFGLVGTVLGLVSLMRALTENSSSSETGVRMAVALVATLYGLIVSNLVLNPAGEAILKQAMNEKHDAELMLQALLLAADGSSLLEAHEMLNSFVQKKHRRSFAQSEETPNAGAA